MRRRRSRISRRWPVVALVLLALVGAVAVGVRACRNDTIAAPGSDGTAQEGLAPESITLAHPTYLGGARRRQKDAEPGPRTLDLQWKLPIGSGATRLPDGALVSWSGTGWTGQPTLVVVDGVPSLVIGGYDHGLRRIDAATGTVIWRAELEDVIKGTNTIYYDPRRPAGDRLVVVSGSRRGPQRVLGDPAIAPLRAFSFATGEELWRLPIPKTENYSQDVDASPLFVDGRLIAAIEPGYVLALDTSKLVDGPEGHPMPTIVASSPPLWAPEDVAARPWMGGSNLALEGSPAVLGDRIYIASSSGHVYGLDRETLAIEWDFAPGGDFDSTVVVTPEGKLLVGMERQYVEHAGVFMLDPSKPPAEAVDWFFPTEDRGIGEWQGGVVGSVALHPAAPLAAFCSVDGYVYVVRTDLTEDGGSGPRGDEGYKRPVMVFKDHVGGSISTPAMVNDRMVAVGLDRMVHLYEIADPAGNATFAEIGTFTAEGPFESTPLVWEGRVYVGCRDGYLYCLGDR